MSSLFQKASGKFYDKWESATQEERKVYRREQLDSIIAFAKERTTFYSNRLAEYAAKADHPLKDISALESEHLRAHLPPVANGLVSRDLIHDNPGVSVFQSGGTTGNPKTSLFSNEELEWLNLGNARGFYALGLEPRDRAANLWAVGGLYMTFIHINRMLQQYGCMSFPFSNHTAIDFIHEITRQFKMNTFTGITSVCLNTVRQLRELDPKFRFEKLFFGGEHIYATDIQELKESFDCQVVGAPGYGTVDTWYIGYQCQDCDTGEFHAHDDQCYIEILQENDTGDPAKGAKICGAGEVGMLYATPTVRTLTPIIRYRVGDKARWIEKPCSCGRTTAKFKLLGRGDNILRIGYDSIEYESILGVASVISELSGTLQMEKRRIDNKDQLIIRVESHGHLAATERDHLVIKLHEALLAVRPSLREFLKKGSIQPIQIEIKNPGTIPLNDRTGKLRRVIDLEPNH